MWGFSQQVGIRDGCALPAALQLTTDCCSRHVVSLCHERWRYRALCSVTDPPEMMRGALGAVSPDGLRRKRQLTPSSSPIHAHMTLARAKGRSGCTSACCAPGTDTDVPSRESVPLQRRVSRRRFDAPPYLVGDPESYHSQTRWVDPALTMAVGAFGEWLSVGHQRRSGRSTSRPCSTSHRANSAGHSNSARAVCLL